MQSSPPSSNSLSFAKNQSISIYEQQPYSQNNNTLSLQNEFLDPQQNSFSQQLVNYTSVNMFLNSYQILKKIQNQQIHEIVVQQKQQTNGNNGIKYMLREVDDGQNVFSNSIGINNVSSGTLSKDHSYNHLKKKQDKISQLSKNVSKQNSNHHSNSVSPPQQYQYQSLSFQHSYTSAKGQHSSTFSQTIPYIKLPHDNDFVVLNSNIKTNNLFIRAKTITQNTSSFQSFTNTPMCIYPEWKQVVFEIKKIFNKTFQCPMKQLNSGSLIAIKPKESLNLRSDYYCFYPHQIYTTLLALDRTDMTAGTLAFCRLNKEFVLAEYGKYSNEIELLNSLSNTNAEMTWEYLDMKEGCMYVVGRDVIYGSFRNDSSTTKYFAQMRWVKHDSASNSSNSS